MSDAAKPKGPLELRPVTSREDGEDFLAMGCPFCGGVVKFTPPDAVLWTHQCPNDPGETVYFLNGHAIKGAGRYNRANIPKGRS